MAKTYWMQGKEIPYIEGYHLSQVQDDLDTLGVTHIRIEVKEVECWCVTEYIDQDSSRKVTHPKCPYHTTHTPWGALL